jgi:hypothetical protein
MEDEETKRKRQALICQIQEKSLQLADLEVILEDYQRERQELLREISRLKASLWELVGDAKMPLHVHGKDLVESAREAND